MTDDDSILGKVSLYTRIEKVSCFCCHHLSSVICHPQPGPAPATRPSTLTTSFSLRGVSGGPAQHFPTKPPMACRITRYHGGLSTPHPSDRCIELRLESDTCIESNAAPPHIRNPPRASHDALFELPRIQPPAAVAAARCVLVVGLQ